MTKRALTVEEIQRIRAEHRKTEDELALEVDRLRRKCRSQRSEIRRLNGKIRLMILEARIAESNPELFARSSKIEALADRARLLAENGKLRAAFEKREKLGAAKVRMQSLDGDFEEATDPEASPERVEVPDEIPIATAE